MQKVDELRKQVSDKAGQVLSLVPRVKQALVDPPEQSEHLASLLQERDLLLRDQALANNVLELQSQILQTLNKQQSSLLLTLHKFKKKAASRIENVCLGKRQPLSESKETKEVGIQTMPHTADAGVQVFDFVNECQESVSEIKLKEEHFAKEIEKVFQLLMWSRCAGNAAGSRRKGGAGGESGPDRDPLGLDLASDSGVEDAGSLRFEGNLSPNFSDK